MRKRTPQLNLLVPGATLGVKISTYSILYFVYAYLGIGQRII